MHFGAGPWFTVLELPGGDWRSLGQVWWSDGRTDGRATLELRATLDPPDPAHDPFEGGT